MSDSMHEQQDHEQHERPLGLVSGYKLLTPDGQELPLYLVGYTDIDPEDELGTDDDEVVTYDFESYHPQFLAMQISVPADNDPFGKREELDLWGADAGAQN